MVTMVEHLRSGCSQVTLYEGEAEKLAVLIQASATLQAAWIGGRHPTDDEINAHYLAVSRFEDLAIPAMRDRTKPVTPAGGEVNAEAVAVVRRRDGETIIDWLIEGGESDLDGAWLCVTDQPLPQDGAVTWFTHPPVADAALVRDAERYRWLRDNVQPWRNDNDKPHAIVNICRGEMEDGKIGWFNIIGRYSQVGIITLDEAIDAALNQRGGV